MHLPVSYRACIVNLLLDNVFQFFTSVFENIGTQSLKRPGTSKRPGSLVFPGLPQATTVAYNEETHKIFVGCSTEPLEIIDYLSQGMMRGESLAYTQQAKRESITYLTTQVPSEELYRLSETIEGGYHLYQQRGGINLAQCIEQRLPGDLPGLIDDS